MKSVSIIGRIMRIAKKNAPVYEDNGLTLATMLLHLTCDGHYYVHDKNCTLLMYHTMCTCMVTSTKVSKHLMYKNITISEPPNQLKMTFY